MPVEIPINLASAPFRRNRALIVASVAAGVALTCLLAVLIPMAISGNREQDQTTPQISTGLEELEYHGARAVQAGGYVAPPRKCRSARPQHLPEQGLLYRKGISWTKIFADLEKVMPYNVRLISGASARERAKRGFSRHGRRGRVVSAGH